MRNQCIRDKDEALQDPALEHRGPLALVVVGGYGDDRAVHLLAQVVLRDLHRHYGEVRALDG